MDRLASQDNANRIPKRKDAMRQFRIFLVAVVGPLLLASNVFAHPDHSEHTHGVWDGVTHPLLGLDHLLAMVTVGLLAAQRGGRAVWAVPSAFVLSMIVGGIAGMCGVALPAVEFGTITSIVLLGGAWASGRKDSLVEPLLFAAVFGFFHGHAHGTEMPLLANPALYAAGFVTSTIVLHVVGVVLGRFAIRSAKGATQLRVCGAVIACTGVVFMVIP